MYGSYRLIMLAVEAMDARGHGTKLSKGWSVYSLCLLIIFSVKISALAHPIVKQICFSNGNVLFLSLFSLSKN